jgi:uncharacterized membrane-anchored protein YhcB (DUF1043 family)
MSWDNLIGIVAVVIGTILGYLASYFNNRQQRKWQLDSEYRSWKRTEIEKNLSTQKIMPLSNCEMKNHFLLV